MGSALAQARSRAGRAKAKGRRIGTAPRKIAISGLLQALTIGKDLTAFAQLQFGA